MKKYGVITILLIAIYIVAFSFTCHKKYQTFAYDDFDLATANQIIWNSLHGDPFYSSIHGGSFLKFHAPLIYLLLLPFYALWPSPVMLLYAQTILLALAGLPIYLIAKRELKIGSMALVFLTVYLLYPPLGYLSLGHPHGVTFAPFFLAWAYYFFRRDRYAFFITMLCLAMTAREEISFIVVTVGICALWERKGLKWWVAPISLGVIWFAFYFFWLLPYLRGGEKSPFLILFSEVGGSPAAILRNIFTRPFYILGVVFKPHKLVYIFRMLVPLAFMPLLSPGILFICLPNLFLNLLADRQDVADIFFQYNAILIPFIFFAGVMGFARLRRFIKIDILNKIILMAILITGVVSSWCLGPQLHLLSKTWEYSGVSMPKEDFLTPVKWEMVEMVPPDVPVTTHFKFCTYLSGRKELEFLPWVLYGQFGNMPDRFRGRSDIESALIDFGDVTTFVRFYNPKTSPERMRRLISENRLGLVKIYDQIALYKRGESDAFILYESLGKEKGETQKGYGALFNDLGLNHVELEIVGDRPRRQLRFSSLWKARKKLNDDFSMLIRIEDESGNQVLQQPRSICYHMYPTDEWEEGELIRANHLIALPPELPPGRYRLKMVVINKFPPCRVVPLITPPASIDTDGWLIVGEFEAGEHELYTRVK